MLGPADFGRFALLFLGFSVVLVAQRSLINSTVLVHPEDADHQPRAVIGCTILFASLLGGVCVLVGAMLLASDPATGRGAIWLGALMPLTLLQDLGRYLAISTHRPLRAIVLDGTWIALEVGGFLVLLSSGTASFETCVVVWAVAGALSSLWVFIHAGFPRISDLSFAWLRSRWHFSWRSFVSNTFTQVAALLGFSAVAVVSGGVAVGALRAANLLSRPGNTILEGIVRSSVADMARERPDTPTLKSYANRTMLLSVVAAAGFLVALVLCPDFLGRAILGQTWHAAEPLLLAAGIQLVCVAGRNGIRGALLSRRDMGVIMQVDIAGSVVLIALTVVGAVVANAPGVMWACVLGQALQTVAWWILWPRRLAALPPDEQRGDTGSSEHRVEAKLDEVRAIEPLTRARSSPVERTSCRPIERGLTPKSVSVRRSIRAESMTVVRSESLT